MTYGLERATFAAATKMKRGDRSLRSCAQEIGLPSHTMLLRIEQGHPIDMETFLLVCSWLQMDPADFMTKQGAPHPLSPLEQIALSLYVLFPLPEEKPLVEALITLIERARR